MGHRLACSRAKTTADANVGERNTNKMKPEDTEETHEYGEEVAPIRFHTMLGEWSRARLWVLYSCFINYLFFSDIRVALPVVVGYEAVNFLVRIITARTVLERNRSAGYILFDILLRLVSSVCGIFIVVYIHYAFDLTRMQGLKGLGYMWFAWTFALLREFTMYKTDYWIVPAHVMLYGLLADSLFFAEWESHVVLAVYVGLLLVHLSLTEYIGYLSFLLFTVLALVTSLIYHLSGPVDNRPAFDEFLT